MNNPLTKQHIRKPRYTSRRFSLKKELFSSQRTNDGIKINRLILEN